MNKPQLTREQLADEWQRIRDKKACSVERVADLLQHWNATSDFVELESLESKIRKARTGHEAVELAVMEARWELRNLDHLLALPESERGKRAEEIAAVARRLGSWETIAASRIASREDGKRPSSTGTPRGRPSKKK